MSTDRKIAALYSLMDRHEVPRSMIANSMVIYHQKGNERILDYWLRFFLAIEACCRSVDPQGRNCPVASLRAFGIVSGASEGFSRSEILEKPDGFIDKVVKLVKACPDSPPRQCALIVTVLKYCLVHDDWPEKSYVAFAVCYEFPGFCNETQDPREVCKDIWKRIHLDWLPKGQSGRPPKAQK